MKTHEDVNAAIYRYLIDYAYYSVGSISVVAMFSNESVESIAFETAVCKITVFDNEEFDIEMKHGETILPCLVMTFIFDLKERCQTIFEIANDALKTAKGGKGSEA